MFSKYRRRIIISVIFGAFVFLGISVYADFNSLIHAFSEFNWILLPVILILSLLNYFIRFIRWHYYLGKLNISLPFVRSLIIFISSFVLAVTPGKMGEVLKSYLLKEENGTEIRKSLPILLTERITDFISIVLLAIIGAYLFNYGKEIIIITGIFFVFFVIVLSYRKLSILLIDILGKVEYFKKYTDKLLTAYDSIYIILKLKPLIVAIFLGVSSWFCECLGLYIVLKGFTDTINMDINIFVPTFIYAFSTLVGAIAMLPGGLGATEASLTGLLVLLNIPKNISAASTIIIRVATLWFAVILGAIFLIIYERTISGTKNLYPDKRYMFDKR